jgi:phosphoribosylamine--glycine ligase
MKILVIGSGAREHAIAETLHRSSHQPHVIISPGNSGMAREFETVALDSFEDIEDFCIIEGIDFVFIGPEQPLADGLADHLRSQGIKVIGPSKAAARIESSKIFAKELMAKHNIPTSRYAAYSSFEDASAALETWSYPIVIKADGLAAGKGVYIAADKEEAMQKLKGLMVEKTLGESGSRIVLEEFLSGWEVSLFAFTDGENHKTTIFSQDHKQLFDDDQGPNTGGMGAYAPVPEAEIFKNEIEKKVIEPTLKAMQEEGSPFQGVLYMGLMITADGPKVIEYNCRLGDPEAQTILPLLETDLVDICQAILTGNLSNIELKWLPKTAVCVYAVGRDYPQHKSANVPIVFSAHMESHAFYGGVSITENELVTNGGRILAITAVGLSKTEARNKVYHDLNKVFFEGMHYRKDIGLRENKL